MYRLLAAIAQLGKEEEEQSEQDPIVVVVLDLKNAFNSLKRSSLLRFLEQGCAEFV